MKSLIIASDSSGGGKTTVTLGLMKALKNRGFHLSTYKVGPDYIDPAFHKHITGWDSRNLDIFLMGEAGVKASYSRGVKHGALGIIEGVMGLYDGKGIDTEYSTAHVAKVLNIPVILVLSPKAQSTTLCAEINGILNFDRKVKIAGVILNNIGESYYKLLKAAIEKHCSIEVFGFIPKDDKLSIKSRHLGLIQSSEIQDLNEKIDYLSELFEKYVDIDSLLKIFKDTNTFKDDYHLDDIGINIAVAKDKAFSFYYKENIELLEELGNVTYFSPMKDKAIPENTDFLYLGGGYPEVFSKELSENKEMLQSIKTALDSGLCCYGECGGLMYLCNTIDNVPMVNFLKGKAYLTNRLQNFGYAKVCIKEENKILPKGMEINCHEFHKSYIESEEKKIYEIMKESYDGKIKCWNCGYAKGNTLAAYAHIHFFSNINFLKEIIKRIPQNNL